MNKRKSLGGRSRSHRLSVDLSSNSNNSTNSNNGTFLGSLNQANNMSDSKIELLYDIEIYDIDDIGYVIYLI
jgi:hypothetical protein